MMSPCATPRLLRAAVMRHHLLVAKRKRDSGFIRDSERVTFAAPLGSRQLYQRIAGLEGVPLDAWIRQTLYVEAQRALEEHGLDTTGLPDAHFRRPPRLQPRLPLDDEDGGSS